MRQRGVAIGVVGYGYWGPNLVRNFSNIEEAQVVAVSDLDPGKLSLIKAATSWSFDKTIEFRDLLLDSRIDAIAIATPYQTYDYSCVSSAAGW